jgi:hypothetical protein
MVEDRRESSGPSRIRRLWQRLTTPSATWSVLALVIVGLVVGAGGVIATQVMVSGTGTNGFCSGACHSMQWVAQEYRHSIHYLNPKGIQAGCHDCHIPHTYPQLLWVALLSLASLEGMVVGFRSVSRKCLENYLACPRLSKVVLASGLRTLRSYERAWVRNDFVARLVLTTL